MAWTEQQQNAIDICGRSVIVSAAAGSGKTAVLTERLTKLIADENSKVRADRMVVVTFTNDAASELKTRLDSKLREMISNDPGNKYLLKQQNLLQNARISTINSFCFELLRDNISEQGITSGFSVLDESDNELIKAQAMDEMLNWFSRDEYEKISYMYDKFCLKNDHQLADVINIADKYLSSAAMREKWLEKAVSAFSEEPDKSIYFKKLVSDAEKKLEKALASACQRLEMAEDIFDNSEKPAALKYFAQAEDDIVQIHKAVDLVRCGRILDDKEIETCTSFGRLVTVKRTEDVNAEVLEFCNAKRKNAVQITSEALQMFRGFNEDYEESRCVTEILAEMLKRYHSIIWQKKCEKNALSFDDGERLVLELLADTDEKGNIIQSETALKIAEYYDIIMIDEYQDSNNKQDLIFKLISKDYGLNSSGEPVYGSNAFLVGDVKQSIYKFRLANPKNFISTLKNSHPYSGEAESGNCSVFLNKNFRSSHGVIDFVNYIFSQLMSEKCGDVVYDENEQLNFGAAEYNSAENNYSFLTNIAFINTESEEDDEERNIAEKINCEADYTAAKIFSMIKNGEKVVMKDGRLRPCEPSDFCILVRKNRYTKEYINALKKFGIEARGEEEKGYLSSREITVLIDLLRIVDNPLLDVNFAAVMMSPMYMFEFEELAYLKALDKNSHLYIIINNLVSNKYHCECDSFFVERCVNFLEALDKFRLFSVTMTVSELIGKIYDDTDFISVMQLYTDGEKKRANLRALVQYAKNYENSASFEGSGGLSGFIRYIDRLISSGSDFSQGKISTSTGNYTAVKTIHKSKGLEYPFVFLAETSSKIMKDHPVLMCSDDSRIGYVMYNQKLVRRYRTSAYNQIIGENNADILSEEMRLLYVAVTRAKQKLFINLKYNDKIIKSVEKFIDLYHQEESLFTVAQYAKSHADWIWMALFENKDFAEICQNVGIHAENCCISGRLVSDRLFETEYVVSSSPVSKANESETLQDVYPDSEICENLKNIINFSYNKTLSETPAKLSVTQIVKKFKGDNGDVDFTLKRPKFADESGKITGAERGTAIHTFFQYCDFERASSDIESEIERVMSNGYLSAPQAASIDRDNARAFFSSDLFRRIAESKAVFREKKFMIATADLNIENELMKSFRQSDGMIKGIIDLAFVENGSLVIVDYKSDRRTSESVLAEKYKMQLNLYKLALELTMELPVSGLYLYSFELKKEIKVET